jgi:hypothetical protein
LKVPCPTSSAAIVSGADATQTNIFLEHLSILSYASKEKVSIDTMMLPPAQLSPRAQQQMEREKIRAREMWTNNILIAVSSDGRNFTETSSIETNLMGPSDTKRLQLDSLFSDPSLLQSVKIVRIYAASWFGPLTCVRVGLSCYLKAISSSNVTGGTGGGDASSTNDFQNLFRGLTILTTTSDLLTRALNHLITIQELETTRKQDEVRKVSSSSLPRLYPPSEL